jgi:hypothetical protein
MVIMSPMASFAKYATAARVNASGGEACSS